MNKEYKIVLINGDGIGEEIVAAAKVVLEKVANKYQVKFDFTRALAGGEAIDAVGVSLPDTTIEACKKADAVLLGAVGGPKWDHVAPKLRPEQAILGLRKALSLYVNLRPIKVFDALLEFSPLKPENVADTDLLIVRELNGGIYYGEKKEAYIDTDGVEKASDLEIYSRPEIERLMNFTKNIAKLRNKKVTSVDKANVLASSRLWRKITNDIIGQDSELELEHLYVDNCAMQMVLKPKQFDVVVTNNIFGDILSDEAAVIAGSIGMLPSASLGDGTALYEPIHGSAPDIAGQNIANPLGTILSAAMMLKYSLNMSEAAEDIEQAVKCFLQAGYRTADLYRPGLKKVGTNEVGELISQYVK